MADHLETTRSSYDTVAADYAGSADRLEGEAGLWDRTALTAFAELVDDGRVADIGCGPGRVTAFLAGLRKDVVGIDLSPGMIAEARKLHPHLEFEVGDMTALDLADGSLAGISAWYSTIHLPDEQLPRAFTEFHRVLEPGGHVVLAFQVGDEIGERTEAFGHRISLTWYRRPPERVAEMLADAGFSVRATVVREPHVTEKVAQAYLFGRK